MAQQTNYGRLLYLVKQFYQEATNLVSVADNLSAMKAALFLDLSVEQMLYILIADFGSQSPGEIDEPNWAQLWQAALKAVKERSAMTRLPHYRELKTLHGIRNQVQHQGVAPNPGELGRFIRAASDMLSACFQEAYGLSFTTFQPWDEIRNPDLQRLIRESQEALEAGNVFISLTGSLLAFQKVVGALKQSQLTSSEQLLSRRTSRPRFQLDTGPPSVLHLAAQAERFLAQIQEATSRELEMLREQGLINKLGLSLYDTGKYRQLTENITVHDRADGLWNVRFLTRDETDQDSGRFALSYITQLLLVAQDVALVAIAEIRIPIPLTEQPIWKDGKEVRDH